MKFNEEEEIENFQVIMDHFGYWPSFHDSEVISIHFKRNFEESNPVVEIQVYAFEMTDKLQGRHFKLIKHCVVEFELIGIYENSMGGFNHQNSLSGIDFDRQGEFIVCELHGAYGVDARFLSKQIRVKSLMPINK